MTFWVCNRCCFMYAYILGKYSSQKYRPACVEWNQHGMVWRYIYISYIIYVGYETWSSNVHWPVPLSYACSSTATIFIFKSFGTVPELVAGTLNAAARCCKVCVFPSEIARNWSGSNTCFLEANMSKLTRPWKKWCYSQLKLCVGVFMLPKDAWFPNPQDKTMFAILRHFVK